MRLGVVRALWGAVLCATLACCDGGSSGGACVKGCIYKCITFCADFSDQQTCGSSGTFTDGVSCAEAGYTKTCSANVNIKPTESCP